GENSKLRPYHIARSLHISHSPAASGGENYKETNTVDERPHPGRKRKLSAAETEVIVRMAKKRKVSTEIARSFKKRVSPATIQRTLKREGFFYGKIIKVEKLTKV